LDQILYSDIRKAPVQSEILLQEYFLKSRRFPEKFRKVLGSAEKFKIADQTLKIIFRMPKKNLKA